MLNKIIIVLISLLVLIGCSKDRNDRERILFGDASVNFVSLNDEYFDEDLLSIEYRIINQTKESTGPFHVNVVIHDKILQDYLGLEQYTSYEKMGHDGMEIGAGDVFQSGENLHATKGIGELYRSLNPEHQLIELQMVNPKTEEVIASKWIHNFLYVDETTAKPKQAKSS